MSTPLYSYSPRPQQVVNVELPPDGAAEAFITAQFNLHSRVCVAIPDVAVPEVARGILAALHEAAGLPVPIVLDRPELSTEISCRFGFTIGVTASRDVRIGIEDEARTLSPSAARDLAEHIAARADVAASTPDPAQVEALAAITGDAMRSFWKPRTHVEQPLEERVARAILARYTLTERKPGAAS